MLPDAPGKPIENGELAFGTYRGRCESTDLGLRERRVSPIRGIVSERRWQWFTAFADEYAVGGAIVDAGLYGTAFLWVFDRESGSMVVDDDVIVPSPVFSVTDRPTSGSLARVALPGYRLEMSRSGDVLTVDGRFAGVGLDLEFHVDDRAAITAICPVPERRGGVNVTQKEPGVDVRGTLSRIENSTEPVALDGTGFLDYSHGLLGRKTKWDWAFGSATATDGTPVAFNLVDHFNEGLENVVWVDGDAESVGAATISEDDSSGDWTVTSECGTVDAVLTVEGRRSRDLDLGFISSSYHQPLGRWHGTVGVHDVEGVGVAEEHETNWGV